MVGTDFEKGEEMEKFARIFGVFLFLIAFSNSFVTDALGSEVLWEEEAEEIESIADPFEGYNRAIYRFNDKLYFYALKPIAQGYKKIVPSKARISVRKFFNNVALPVRLTNCTLQGKMKGAGVELSRFAINSTLGIAGLFDPAKSFFNLRKYDVDSDQTLGFYGLKTGSFLMLPIFGPSSVRGSFGLLGDTLLNPTTWIFPNYLDYKYLGVRAYEIVNQTSLTIGEYEDLKKAAIDPYISLRNAYFQHLKSKTGGPGKKDIWLEEEEDPAMEMEGEGSSEKETLDESDLKSKGSQDLYEALAKEKTADFNDTHFDFDDFSLKTKAKASLKGLGAWLVKHSDVSMLIEGHCDERGTDEYNLVLGERRAQSAKAYLIRLGVKPARIATISYGEEKPLVRGHHEEAWAKNRRAHFLKR